MAPRSNDENSGADGPVPFSWFNRDWLLGLILILAVILTYQPVWHAGYIWDDDLTVTHNPCVVGPYGLKQIWTTKEGQFYPLVLTTFWAEHKLWGLRPVPYHMVNVLQEAACAVLLWRVLLSLRVPGAWLGAALWALHPVQVESVAWISEMKNTESGLFFLLSILFFVRWLRTGEDRKTTDSSAKLTLIFAALAMASKSSTVVLPGVLALCAWRVEGRWNWRILKELAPIFLMSVIASAVTIAPNLSPTATADLQWSRTWPQKVATAGDVIWFYLGKLLWPHQLIAIYPRWQIDAGRWLPYLPLLAAIIVLFVFWLRRGSWARPYFFAYSYFLIALSPFLGLLDQGFWRFSFVQDHLQYLACMGPLALLAAGLTRAADFALLNRPLLREAFCGVLLAVIGITSWERVLVYKNQQTLWTDTVAKNPDSWIGQNNLGVVLRQQGQLDAAIAHYHRSLEINPDFDKANFNLGDALLQEGKWGEAIPFYEKALKLNPKTEHVHCTLGIAYFQDGRVPDAIVEYKKALEIDPRDDEARYQLGNAFVQQDQIDEAIAQYRMTLKYNPNYLLAYNNLGAALLQQGQFNEAIIQFQKSLQLNPNDTSIQNNLARARSLAGER
jgi:protein O-mannosyl-transferase